LITEYNKDKREGVHRVAYLKGIVRVFAFECSLDIEKVHFITTRTTRLHGEHVRRAPLRCVRAVADANELAHGEHIRGSCRLEKVDNVFMVV
jgi:hypothetical protein